MAQLVDIGILTIRDDEHQALLDVFPDELADGYLKGKHREYGHRRADAGKLGSYSLAILKQHEQGNGEAQDAARDLLEDVEPSLLLVVGIAGGFPSDELTLGDVVLSTRINDYCVEARKEGAEAQYALSGGPIDRQIQGGISNLAARTKDLGDWTAGLSQKPAVDWMREGQLYGPAKWQEELREKLDAHYGKDAIPRPPRFTSGVIASSDKLVKEPELLFPWIQTARNLLAVEMESGGVYRAARGRCPMLSIRALSDIVGLRRANAWTKYAAEAAAAFTRAYLRTSPIAPSASKPTPPASGSPPSNIGSTTHNALNISGSHVEAANIVVGVQQNYNIASSAPSLDAIAKLVEHGLLDPAAEQLESLERSSWASMSKVEKYRHRKLQGRVLVLRGQPRAAADRYDEAASFIPEDEKSHIHRIDALMLRDDIVGAHQLATQVVAQFPSLILARAVWIRSAPTTRLSDDLLPKPWDGLDPDVASALADRLINENRAKDALEVLQRAHSPGVNLPFWGTYSNAALRYQEQLGRESGPPELLAEGRAALEKALKLCVGEGFRDGKVQLLLNMSYVHRLNGDLDGEWDSLREAAAISPKNKDVRLRTAKVLVDRGRETEAITIFESLLEDGPDYAPFLLGVSLAKRNAEGDLERAAQMFEQTATLITPSVPLLTLDGADGFVQVCRAMKQWDRALAGCTTFAPILGEFRSRELAARIHLERGDKASAERVLADAVEWCTNPEQQRILGLLSAHAGNYERAVVQLESVTPWNEWTESTAALLRAAQATDRDELTIRICRQLRESGISRNSVIDAEAELFKNEEKRELRLSWSSTLSPRRRTRSCG